ncbi:DUF1330 domain-containing protein [Uruburuella testudinis]|uniref:DUF1330 domain-containing protein n=1 Tax=Uruburuella testudinis TaxID=1282863 RepID=A0ABY4DST5_9NEIS|nr:DUF1330 domain-containing protein [Uruburuella testudinis]UOO81069.1 DUF1330 domain-containing protein [Uruburuella testudinis]
MKPQLLLAAALLTCSGLAAAARPAYYVAEFQPAGNESIRPYSAAVENTFKPYGGRFIVRGGEADVKEGFGVQGRLVMIKFDSLAQAQAWYQSPAYQQIIPIRQRAGNSRTYIVEGLEE